MLALVVGCGDNASAVPITAHELARACIGVTACGLNKYATSIDSGVSTCLAGGVIVSPYRRDRVRCIVAAGVDYCHRAELPATVPGERIHWDEVARMLRVKGGTEPGHRRDATRKRATGVPFAARCNMSQMLDLDRDWARMEERAATIKRVSGTLVSVTFGGFTEPATFRASTVPAQLFTPGAAIVVAGAPTMQAAFKVWAVEISGKRFWVDRDAASSALAGSPLAPTSPPVFVDVLVAHGLLDDASQVEPRHFACGAPELLASIYPPRGALARGLVHYDHRWRNDTQDPIGDLATIVRCPEIRAVRIGRQSFRFAVDAAAHEVFDADDLEELAAAIDRWLARDFQRLRLFSWVTGDRHVFLARPLAEGLALAKALDTSDLVPASQMSEPATGDDFF